MISFSDSKGEKMKVAQTGLESVWCALRTSSETYCGLVYREGFRWIYGDGFPTCPQCIKAMPPQSSSASDAEVSQWDVMRNGLEICNISLKSLGIELDFTRANLADSRAELAAQRDAARHLVGEAQRYQQETYQLANRLKHAIHVGDEWRQKAIDLEDRLRKHETPLTDGELSEVKDNPWPALVHQRNLALFYCEQAVKEEKKNIELNKVAIAARALLSEHTALATDFAEGVALAAALKQCGYPIENETTPEKTK